VSGENIVSFEAELGAAVASLRVEGFSKAADKLEQSLNAARAGHWRDSLRLAHEAAKLEAEARARSGRRIS
jgi:hypothetical protein